MLSERGDGEAKEVQVTWEGWNGPPEWGRLADNPQLALYLTRNRANPHTSTLEWTNINVPPSPHRSLHHEVLAVRQALFDALGGDRATREGTLGRQTRIAESLPFSKAAFDAHFQTLGHPGIPHGEHGNVSCQITCEELGVAFGLGWASRSFENTSTVAYINFREFCHLTWGYRERLQYNAFHCPR